MLTPEGRGDGRGFAFPGALGFSLMHDISFVTIYFNVIHSFDHLFPISFRIIFVELIRCSPKPSACEVRKLPPTACPSSGSRLPTRTIVTSSTPPLPHSQPRLPPALQFGQF